MIACPVCGSATDVRETREGAEAKYIRRRRFCKRIIECGHRVTTFEVIVPNATSINDPVVVERRLLAALAGSLGPDED